MSKPNQEQFKVAIKWPLLLFCLGFIPLFISLGFWQLSRAVEKDAIEHRSNRLKHDAVQALDHLSFDSLENYSRVKLSGHFLTNMYWLKENQVVNGRLGFDVLMPFELLDERVVIVNRGWVEGLANYRTQLPTFSTPKQQITLEALVIEPSKNRFLAGEPAMNLKKAGPRLILSSDTEQMQSDVGRPLPRKIALLTEQSAGLLTFHWRATNMKATKHRAYAFQWFSMAFALSVLGLVTNTNLFSWLASRLNHGPSVKS